MKFILLLSIVIAGNTLSPQKNDTPPSIDEEVGVVKVYLQSADVKFSKTKWACILELSGISKKISTIGMITSLYSKNGNWYCNATHEQVQFIIGVNGNIKVSGYKDPQGLTWETTGECSFTWETTGTCTFQ